MAPLIYFYLGKFGLFNIFPDLKSKQIKCEKKTKFVLFLLFIPKQSLFTLFKTLISQKLYHQSESNKFVVIMIRLF